MKQLIDINYPLIAVKTFRKRSRLYCISCVIFARITVASPNSASYPCAKNVHGHFALHYATLGRVGIVFKIAPYWCDNPEQKQEWKQK